MFRNGKSPSTRIGYVNRNNQRCEGHRGVKGNDHMQYAYKMACQYPECGHIYGSNGTDVFQRKCPQHQDGRPGITF